MKRISILWAVGVFLFIHQGTVHAAVDANLEVPLAQATLLYHSGRYNECLQAVKAILAQDANNVSGLELKALSHRKLDDDGSAVDTYEKLLKVSEASKQPAYHFELATIQYQRKKFKEARMHFDKSAEGKFNPGTSNFFLGVMDFEAKQWKKARSHLAAALTYSDADKMIPVTRYYLATAYAQLGRSDAAAHNYYEAEESTNGPPSDAKSGKANPLLDQIHQNALKELKSLDKNQRNLSISLISQWDSNVQTNPSDIDNVDVQSAEKSLKTVISAGGSYSTSPTKNLQITPGYSFYTNYNYNYLARDFNFMTHAPSLYLVHRPYKQLALGVKALGTFSMKNQLDATDDRSKLKYRPFSLIGDVGPTAKYEVNAKITLAAEATWRPKRYYLDPPTGSTRRSGQGMFTRVSADYVSGFAWWNPLGYLSFEWDYPAGGDFRAYTYGGGLSNTFDINDRLTLTGFVDLYYANYYDTLVPKRDDINVVYRAAASYAIDAHWTGIADLGYTANNSSISTSFTYDRIIVSGGATYSF